MPTPTTGRRLGGSPAHQRHMMANLATALFEHGKITTTEARARRLRPVAERLITFAKRGDLHARVAAAGLRRGQDPRRWHRAPGGPSACCRLTAELHPHGLGTPRAPAGSAWPSPPAAGGAAGG